MYLRYGNYTHDWGEVTLSITRSEVVAENGQAVGYTERWDVQGEKITDDHATMAAHIAALNAAYSVQSRDAVFFDDNGVILHALRAGRTVGGVQVIPPSYPYQDNQALYATGIRFTLALTAEFSTALAAGLVSFQETLAFSGGGPVYVWRQPLQGRPRRQQTATHSVYRLTQSGRAVGRYGYPSIPGPLYPALVVQGPDIQYTGPETRTGQFLNYSVSWSYQMESDAPMRGVPTLPRI